MVDTLTDEQVWSTEAPSSVQPQNDNRPLSDEEVWTPPAQQIVDKQKASQSVVGAFGQGFSAATQNYEQLGISPENQDAVQQSGIYKNSGLLGQAVYDQLVSPAAALLDAAMRTGVGTTVSGPLYAANQILTNLGFQSQNTGENQAEVGTEMILNSPALAEFHLPKFTAADFAKAKSVAATMPEDVFTGVKEPTPEQVAIMHNAAAEVAPEVAAIEPESIVPDIHAAARNIAPETFNKYDRLSATQDDLRSQLQDLRDTRAQQFAGNEKQLPQVQDEISTLQNNVDSLIGGKDEAKLNAKKAAQVQDIRSQIDDLKGLQDHLSGVDTPEMYALRQKIQETNYAMRDLAPDVSAAYRKAQEGIGGDETVAAQEQHQAAESTEPVQQNTASNEKSIEQQKQSIISDQAQKLIAAGRPAEEANAAAQLVAEHYAARSERFGGNLGNAEEMYSRDSANIKAGRGVRELAQNDGRELSQAQNIDEINDYIQKTHGVEAGLVQQKDGLHLASLKVLGTKAMQDIVDYADQTGQRITLTPTKDFGATSVSRLEKFYKQFGFKENSGKNKDFSTRERFIREPSLNQQARGKIRLATDDAKAAITLMKNANASTFIHETGHHWLDELMRDATNEHAPADLIKDSQTVRDWLGVKDGEEIPTKAHEKFARGFERYLMEGTAPSKQLAGIFAKFKQWLTKLYQTVDKLRSPISDDIRDVFDRLLAKNPEKTVIAPEHDAGKMMADIHETDAEHTAPEHAAEVADNINNERQRLKGQNNVTDTENPASNAGNAEPPANGAAAAGEGIPTQQSSTVGTSGDKIKAEGEQLRSATEQPSVSKSDAASRGTESAEVLPRPKSDLIDKAGNIRLDNLNAPESVNEVIRQIAAENNDFNDARGVVSDDQVMRLADSLGIKVSEVQLKRIASTMGPGQLASKIMAARKLLVQSATNVRDLMAKAAIGSDEDVVSYAEAKQRHIMIQSQVSGITAEAGRALRAFRNIEGSKEAQSIGDFLKQATGKDLFQLKEEAKLGAALDTPEKVSKFIEDSKKPSFGDMLLEYWVNGLISGPATHTTYAIGNALLGLWKAIPETAVASLLGKLRGDNAIKLGEVGAQLKGAYENLPLAVSAAAKAARTGLTTLLPNEEIASTQFGGKGIPEQVGNEAVSWMQAGSDAFGAIKGLRDAFVASGDLAQTGAIPDFAIGNLKIPVGSIIRSPARAIAAIHSFFRTVNYSMDKASIAYRTATDEGLIGNAFDARVADIVQNPSEEIMSQERNTATNLTLMGEGGEFTKAISKLTNASVSLPILGQTKLLKFIDPFVHIGSNVIDQSILQRTPVGLLSSQIRADLSGANGVIARDFAASRMIVGTALAMTIGGLASEGLVSGSGPSDPKESAAWRMLGGNQPHSIKIGNVWYDTHRLGPLGMIVGIAADMHDVANAASTEDMTKVGSMLVHAITQNILDESFMRGPSDLIKALTDSDRYGDSYIRNFVSSFVPFSVGLSQEARAIDPYSRQTRTVMDAIKDKIPYVSESLYPRRDIWGQPIANKDVLGAAGFSAIYESQISNDPVNQRLLALGVYPSQPERKIRGIQLTDQQYDDFSKIAGQLAKMRLDSIVSNPAFKNLPEVAQIDAIKGTIKSARETASSIIMMRNPDIMKQATEQKIAIMTTGRKKPNP